MCYRPGPLPTQSLSTTVSDIAVVPTSETTGRFHVVLCSRVIHCIRGIPSLLDVLRCLL